MEGRIRETKEMKKSTEHPGRSFTEIHVDLLLKKIRACQGNSIFVDPHTTCADAIEALKTEFKVEMIMDGDKVKQYHISW